MQICIFEDNDAFKFEPLSYYRPVFDLVCGITTLRDKILRKFPGNNYSVLCRNYLAYIVKARYPGLAVNELTGEDCLFINGTILPGEELLQQIDISTSEDVLYLSEGVPVVAKLSGSKIGQLKYNDSGIPDFTKLNIRNETVKVKRAEYIFDLIRFNHVELLNDFEHLRISLKSNNVSSYPGVHMLGRENIVIGEGTQIKPGVVLDASAGPILIGKNVVIYPNTVIEGPVYIGDSTIIKGCSTIYSNVSIGNVCKIGGELEDVVVLDYSNKQHSGFIGHSYLGSWINLGAGTNCSDLKNNYSPVKIKLGGKEINTGMQFLGLIMGDHTKTAINTMFNTGTVAGFSANIFGSGFPDKNIPSFSWGGGDGFVEYKIDRSIETARIVMARRNILFTDAEDKLFRKIFNLTADERKHNRMTGHD